MDKEVHKAFTENTVEYFAHVQTVCTRPFLRGGGTWEKEARAFEPPWREGALD